MHYLYVCNWKMFVDRSLIDCFLKLCEEEELKFNEDTTIIICPSFSFLYYVHTQSKMISRNFLKIGAQDCSQFSEGAYTGEVPARDLKEIGCQYAIIGHIERRKFFNESDQIILAKAKNLLVAGMTPIICIGPFEGSVYVPDICTYVTKQVNFFMHNFDKGSTVVFAYEPYQAIGTNEIPSIHAIAEIIDSIKTALNVFNTELQSLVIYGGSVNEHSIKTLKTIQGIDGFLVGRASIDFQKLKNIISY